MGKHALIPYNLLMPAKIILNIVIYSCFKGGSPPKVTFVFVVGFLFACFCLGTNMTVLRAYSWICTVTPGDVQGTKCSGGGGAGR